MNASGMSSRAEACPPPFRPAIRRAAMVLSQFAIVWVVACSGDGTGPSTPGGNGAPTNVAVVSTLDHHVQISWDAVPQASEYNLYRSTTAGVTPASGTKIRVDKPIGDDGRFFVFDSVGTGTYFYVVTALGPAGESGGSSEVRADVSDLISFTVRFPVPGTVVQDSVFISVFTQSTFEIASVTATADDRQKSLVFSNTAPGSGAWQGFLDLRGLAGDTKNVTITIRDVRGNQVQTVVPVQFNVAPAITVEAPLPYTVARPTLQVTATCTVGTAPCQTLEVNTGSTTLASSATGSVNTTVDLSQFAGTPVQLRLDGFSASGAHTRRELVRVFVEPSSTLTEYVTVPGRVLDVQPGRVLWRDSTSATTVALKIRDVAAGTDTPVPVTNASFEPAFLTPTGAVFVAVTGSSSVAYEWRNSVLTTLATTGISQLVAAGNFAAFSSGSGGRTLTFRDVVAGTSTTVATDASNTGFDVAANGDVVYSTVDGSQIIRFRNGSASVIASSAALPVTDGTNVVFTDNAVAIRLVGPGGLTTLTTRGRLNFGEYQVNNGWTAYRELGPTDRPQVWSRAPDDTRRQVSFFSGGSRLEALGPNGEVVYTAEGYDPQNGRFVSLPPYGSEGSRIGSGLFGQPLFRGTTLYVLIGRSVFTVHP
jgi:hypothetical protein